jgi:hypothetical protein
MRRHAMLMMLALVACAGKGDSGGFGGGGSGGGDDGGIDTSSETGDAAPVVTNVSATFERYNSWVLEFLVDYDYPDDINGGRVHVGVQEGDGDIERFQLVIGSNDARINDGLIQFAFDNVDRSSRYFYEIELQAPDDGPRSEIFEGTVEPVQ